MDAGHGSKALPPPQEEERHKRGGSSSSSSNNNDRCHGERRAGESRRRRNRRRRGRGRRARGPRAIPAASCGYSRRRVSVPRLVLGVPGGKGISPWSSIVGRGGGQGCSRKAGWRRVFIAD
ncbi:unnamed protein product, partial [Ectocarpus sp. 8 AP-2014]